MKKKLAKEFYFNLMKKESYHIIYALYDSFQIQWKLKKKLFLRMAIIPILLFFVSVGIGTWLLGLGYNEHTMLDVMGIVSNSLLVILITLYLAYVTKTVQNKINNSSNHPIFKKLLMFIIYLAVVILATFFLFVPGLIIAIYGFFSIFISDTNISYIKAIRLSREMVSGNWRRLFINILGLGIIICSSVYILLKILSVVESSIPFIIFYIIKLLIHIEAMQTVILSLLALYYSYKEQAVLNNVKSTSKL